MDNTTTNSTVVLASAPMRVFGALTYGILSSLSILMNLLLIAVLAHGHAQFKRMAFFTLAWQMVLCDLMAQSIQLVVAVPVTFAGQAVYGHPGWYYALLFFDTVAYNATLLFSGLLTLSRVCIFFLPAVNQLLFSAGNIMFTVVGLWLFVLAFCCGYPIIGCRKAFSETGFYLYHDCPDPLSTFGIVYRQIAFALSTYLPILMLVAYVFCFIYIRYVFGPRRHHGSSVVGALNGDREEERIERARRQREKNFLIQRIGPTGSGFGCPIRYPVADWYGSGFVCSPFNFVPLLLPFLQDEWTFLATFAENWISILLNSISPIILFSFNREVRKCLAELLPIVSITWPRHSTLVRPMHPVLISQSHTIPPSQLMRPLPVGMRKASYPLGMGSMSRSQQETTVTSRQRQMSLVTTAG